jgi:hypothetical protein
MVERARKRLRKRARRGFRGYPIATVALYGPNDTTADRWARRNRYPSSCGQPIILSVITMDMTPAASIKASTSSATPASLRISAPFGEPTSKVRDLDILSRKDADRELGGVVPLLGRPRPLDGQAPELGSFRPRTYKAASTRRTDRFGTESSPDSLLEDWGKMGSKFRYGRGTESLRLSAGGDWIRTIGSPSDGKPVRDRVCPFVGFHSGRVFTLRASRQIGCSRSTQGLALSERHLASTSALALTSCVSPDELRREDEATCALSSAKVRFAQDSPLEEGVSCELVSGNPNFILERKSRCPKPGKCGI